MLAIRMQRTGRKGHAQFRIVVQESRRHPTSGRFVAQLGHYDPHGKNVVIEKEKASQYMKNGAQPSDRVAKLFQSEGIDLPSWVKITSAKKRSTRNPEKLRKNQPKEEKPAEAPAEELPAPAEETPTEAAASTGKEAEASAEQEETQEAAETKES